MYWVIDRDWFLRTQVSLQDTSERTLSPHSKKKIGGTHEEHVDRSLFAFILEIIDVRPTDTFRRIRQNPYEPKIDV